MTRFRRIRPGFTLVELLLVMGIISVLASVVIVALRPANMLTSAQDSSRKSDAKQLRSALNQYAIDRGALPNAASISTDTAIPTLVCAQTKTDPACVNLDALVSGNYIAAIPQDPAETNANYSGYAVAADANGNPVVASTHLGGKKVNQNLVINGFGNMGNNTNFSAFNYDAVDKHSAGGSFYKMVNTSSYYTDALIPVDPTATYQLIGWAKSGNLDGTAYNPANKQYFGVAPYDVDGNFISPETYGKWPGSTDTTLAAPLNPGDTSMTLLSAAGWSSNPAGYTRNISWWPYADSHGNQYDPYTYTRHTSWNSADVGSSAAVVNLSNGLWGAGQITGNTITLLQPWTGPALPAGTPVRNSTSGGTYKYVALSYVSVPDTWTRYAGTIGGYDTGGAQLPNKFPYGTAYVRIVFVLNYGGVTTNAIRWADIWFAAL